MKTDWRGKTIDVRECMILPGSIRLGDLVLFKGEYMEAITIQRDCPRLENLSHVFTMFTLQTRQGKIVPAELHGAQTVLKKNRRVILV